jgi:hypothetical protein
MTNGQLIDEIGELMEEKKLPVAAYRRLMLRSVSGLLDKTDSMDTMLASVCKDVEKHDDDIDRLKKRDNLNNMLTTAVGAIAAFVGFRN